MPAYRNLDTIDAYGELAATAPFDVRKLSAERLAQLRVPVAAGLEFRYGAAPVDAAHVAALQRLADQHELIAKYRELLRGAVVNIGESRPVLHHLLRGEPIGPVTYRDRDQGAFYRAQRTAFGQFAARVRSGDEVGATGKAFRTVVQIGIGGSDLGPRALYLALREWVVAQPGAVTLEARFVSNVDPDDAAAVLSDLDFATTLFVVVSKSGTTQETLTNQQFVADLVRRGGHDFDPLHHTVAVTSQTSPMARNDGYRAVFSIDDYIGGRYSATSAVGGVILSLALGPEVFERLLAGATEADRAALEPRVTANAALLDALIGVYQRNVLGFATTAVLPYSQALSRFPAHLQQLDMESNGKSVNRAGAPVEYETGPIVFGEPGTNGQHSFYQLLHQGTTIVPLQFIGFRASQRGQDTEFDGSTSQTKLNANLAAQIVAFARGTSDSNPNKTFAGGRPSTLIVGQSLTPEALGALLAHYENKIMFQGFAWNVNSFDQEGVQLGKVLTKAVLGGKPDAELAAAGALLGL